MTKIQSIQINKNNNNKWLLSLNKYINLTELSDRPTSSASTDYVPDPPVGAQATKKDSCSYRRGAPPREARHMPNNGTASQGAKCAPGGLDPSHLEKGVRGKSPLSLAFSQPLLSFSWRSSLRNSSSPTKTA